MMTSSISLRRTLLAGFCASALLMGACSGGDKVPAEEITVEAASLELTKQDETALSRHFQIDPRGGNEADTLALLAMLSLDNATYGERAIEGSTVVYKGWSAADGDAEMTAERIELVGLHDTDDGPSLDRMVLSGVVVEGYEGEEAAREKVMDATVGSLVMISPSAPLFANLVDVIMARDTGSDSVAGVTEDESFRAFQLKDMSAIVNEDNQAGTITVKQVVVGNDTDAGEMDVVLESLNFDWSNQGAGDFVLAMDGMTLMGLDLEALDEATRPVTGVPGQLIGTLTPAAEPPFSQVDLGTLDFTSQWLDMSMEGMEADTTTSGDTTVIRTVLEPMVLTMKDLAGTPVAPYMDALRANGLAEITLKGSSTTTYDKGEDRITLTESKMELDEGLRTDCNYSLLGMNAAALQLRESGLDVPTFDFEGTDDPDAAMEIYFADVEAYGAAQAEANKLIRLESFNCIIQDVPGNSLVDRGYEAAAAITGRPVAVLKGGAKTMIALGSLTAQSEFQRDLMDTVGSGLIDFIDTPGQTMTISINPDAPVSVTSLMGEGGVQPSIKPLNLTVDVQ